MTGANEKEKNMNEKTKQRLKKVGKVALYSAAAVGTLATIAVVCYQPKEGKHSPRSLFRNDGFPRKHSIQESVPTSSAYFNWLNMVSYVCHTRLKTNTILDTTEN